MASLDNKTKNAALLSVILFAVLYTLKCALIAPLKAVLASNVSFDGSVIPMLLGLLGSVMEAVAMAACFGCMLYLMYTNKSCVTSPCVWIFVGFSVYKYLLNTVVSWWLNGAVSDSPLWDVIDVFFYAALEAVLLLVVVALMKGVVRRQKEKDAILKKVGKAEEVYPFEGFYRKGNCLMRAAMLASVAVVVSKLVGLITSDIYTIAMYGVPTRIITVALMLVTYISYALFGVVCYSAMLFVISRLFEKAEAK